MVLHVLILALVAGSLAVDTNTGFGPWFIPVVFIVGILLALGLYFAETTDGDVGQVNKPNHPDRRKGGRRK